MRIFLSHIRRDQPLVQAICSYLPKHIQGWIDEKNIRIGESIGESIHTAIRNDTDFVVIFIGKDSAKSDWVKRELQWALERESELHRTFILPILLDEDAWDIIEPKEFRKRKYLKIRDFDPRGLKNAAEELSDELFAWSSQFMEEANRDSAKIVVEILSLQVPNFEDVLKAQGAPDEAIQQAVELFKDIPKHCLVVRIRNEGSRPCIINGYGIRATQIGKKRFTSHDYAPGQVEATEFPPGAYHEFHVNLEHIAIELKNYINQYSGIADIRGLYQGYSGEEYLSNVVKLNLDTLEVTYEEYY
jgi:hypothetical protein